MNNYILILRKYHSNKFYNFDIVRILILIKIYNIYQNLICFLFTSFITPTPIIYPISLIMNLPILGYSLKVSHDKGFYGSSVTKATSLVYNY